MLVNKLGSNGLRVRGCSTRSIAGIHHSSHWQASPRRLSRAFSASHARADTSSRSAALTRSTELGAAEENQDVASMDRLLRLNRQRAGPSHHSVLPMRSPILWSEALLRDSLGSSASTDAVAPSRPPSDPLVPRNMHDSYCELVLPFASSADVLEQYTNASGGIRTGMLMEHLDSLAGGIAYKHMLGPGVSALTKDLGFYIVTASVDRLDMLAPLYPVRDMRLSGQVIHTGRSSMEIAVRMEALEKDGTEKTILLGRFCMVCRDARTHKATAVNPLIISTPEDQMLFNIGELHKNRRHSRAVRALDRVPPTSAEAEELHALFLKYGQNENNKGFLTAEGERVWMGDTRLEKCLMMFPQERNVHQKIFGGYLMRLAYELGFANSTLFTRGHVRFLSLDGISFARPVPIGSILRLTSHIHHSTSSAQYPAIVHVGVQADVIDVTTGAERTTNDFRFTWCGDVGTPPLERKIIPKTYREAMLWLEGKRALDMGEEIRGMRKGP